MKDSQVHSMYLTCRFMI